MSKIPIILISFIMALSYFFASSMYAPSLPDIESSLHTTDSLAQQSLSFFFIALAFSQLSCGPLSERYGRKPVALVSAIIFLAGSIVCLSSINIHTLLLGRVIQGLGVGGLYLLCRTVLQDSFNKSELMGILAWYGVLFMGLPGLTPVIGGYIAGHYGWQGNFFFMAVLAVLILLVVIFKQKETIAKKNPHAIKPKQMLKDYALIISHPIFLSYLAMMISGTSCILLFQVTGSFVAQNQYGLSVEQFSHGMLVLMAASVSSRLFWNSFLKTRISEIMTLALGVLIQIAGGFVALYSVTIQSYFILVTAFALFAFGSTFLTTVASVSALYLFPNHRGQVGAIYGALQMLGAFGFTLGLSALPTDQINMVIASWLLIALSTVALLKITFTLKQDKEETTP
ncbi:multidrug effflux MFS transporter [Vibrio campbellii]|uniref:Multidrug effflux MFS transporter n=1 Tax=Vibrio campbellii TaxID=680 RepID=A0ABY5I8I5_9VIBR|nr:MFS transporter [Vibrio campbellii]UTZ30641.1 multidrug effflux MFS transporter [Vibrio campbellii]|tara:strand:- start:173 stop:1366 length:1194 start_codon:yes stop_codon:yes gene_type:complete